MFKNSLNLAKKMFWYIYCIIVIVLFTIDIARTIYNLINVLRSILLYYYLS